MRRAVKHHTMIVFIYQRIENAGIDADVNNKESDEKNSGKRHDYFPTN